tara:strand:+ start:214 stop:453 length:240 start_codon:yes stop_codon:yes gene_type:complete
MAWRSIWYDDTKPEPDPFIEGLKEKGCHYNEEEDCWERVWVVATKNGVERSREVYKEVEGEWNVIMYGNEGNVFFEHKV